MLHVDCVMNTKNIKNVVMLCRKVEPIVIGALGLSSKKLAYFLGQLDIRTDMRVLQKSLPPLEQHTFLGKYSLSEAFSYGLTV